LFVVVLLYIEHCSNSQVLKAKKIIIVFPASAKAI